MFSIEYDDTRYRIVDEDGNEGELVEYGSPAALCLTDEDGVEENYSALLNAKPGPGELPDGEGVQQRLRRVFARAVARVDDRHPADVGGPARGPVARVAQHDGPDEHRDLDARGHLDERRSRRQVGQGV